MPAYERQVLFKVAGQASLTSVDAEPTASLRNVEDSAELIPLAHSPANEKPAL